MAGPIHYEVYVRKSAPSAWSLLIASEDRKHAIETAEDQMRDRQAVAVRVSKETLDPETMEFASVVVFQAGAPEEKKKPRPQAPPGPACAGPADLYTPHARALIARALEDWLARNDITAFELLHRPDLGERLEAAGVELQHAIQKVAVPESQATGQDVHNLVRHYQKLADQAVSRLVKAGRDGRFPDIAAQPLADVACRLAGSSDRAFVMGGVIAAALRDARGARARLDRLMDLLDQAPPEGPPRALVLVPVEQILSEMLASRANLTEVLGPSLDLGASLAAVVRLVAPREIEALTGMDPRMALLTPPVEGPATRLAAYLAAGEFRQLSAGLARLVIGELTSPRRLRPGDPVGEIDILRTLATALTATAGRLLTLEEVQNAFVERSKTIVTADFVAAYVHGCVTVLAEAEHLARLCENVTGGVNKRAAARWLSACVNALRFETEMRQSPGPGQALALSPSQKLAALARLQRSVRAALLGDKDTQDIMAAIGVLGGSIEADARLSAQIAKASVPPSQRLTALLRLASGETAPLGAAADRARGEAIRLLKAPEVRMAISATPETLGALKGLMQAAGLAAA